MENSRQKMFIFNKKLTKIDFILTKIAVFLNYFCFSGNLGALRQLAPFYFTTKMISVQRSITYQKIRNDSIRFFGQFY